MEKKIIKIEDYFPAMEATRELFKKLHWNTQFDLVIMEGAGCSVHVRCKNRVNHSETVEFYLNSNVDEYIALQELVSAIADKRSVNAVRKHMEKLNAVPI